MSMGIQFRIDIYVNRVHHQDRPRFTGTDKLIIQRKKEVGNCPSNYYHYKFY